MRNCLRNFYGAQDGAISVDWVVLTAGLIGLTIVILSAFSDSLDVLFEYIRVEMTT